MAMLDLFRQQYLKGKVADKYRLSNGDLTLVIRDETTGRRYHVEFRDGYKAPCLDNLYGLLKGPFSGKTEYLEKLIDAYNRYFFYYSDTPLLVVNTSEIDFVNNPEDPANLVKEIKNMKGGSQHYIPLSSRGRP